MFSYVLWIALAFPPAFGRSQDEQLGLRHRDLTGPAASDSTPRSTA